MIGRSIAKCRTNPGVKFFDFIECSNFSFKITPNITKTRVTSVQQQMQKLKNFQPLLGWHMSHKKIQLAELCVVRR